MGRERIESFNREIALPFLHSRGILTDDIQTHIKDQTSFALRIEPRETEIQPGLLYRAASIELGNGRFTNSYMLCFKSENNSFVPRIITKSQKFYLRKLFLDLSVVAAMNGGFYFLTDEIDYKPVDQSYNLCIRDGNLIGLPAVDRPALMVIGNEFVARDIRAKGLIAVGDTLLAWRGAKARGGEPGESAALYNAACCQIVPVARGTAGRERVTVRETNHTPQGSGYTDVVVGRVNDALVVKDIVKGGGTDFFSANFILQVRGDNLHIKRGSPVSPLLLDDIPINTISSGITIGPAVLDIPEDPLQLEINSDLSLGNLAPFLDRPAARSLVYKDTSGIIYFRIFNAAPKTDYFRGVTPSEVANILMQETGGDLAWAYHLDGGQSSRLVTKQKNNLQIDGTLHYSRWFKRPDFPVLWNAVNGRSVPSAVVLYKRDR